MIEWTDGFDDWGSVIFSTVKVWPDERAILPWKIPSTTEPLTVLPLSPKSMEDIKEMRETKHTALYVYSVTYQSCQHRLS